MSTQHILSSDWSEYDNRKKRYEDRHFFSCTEQWEIDYLVKKIRKLYPSLNEATILSAIRHCCNIVPGNKPRDKFVACVMQQLGKS